MDQGTAAPKLTLRGGEAHRSSLVALWHDDILTDFVVSAEGVEFKAHRVALASSSGYFLNLFKSGKGDAVSPTHTLKGISPAALKALLTFVYEGACEIKEGLLAEVLEAATRLVVDALKDACADVIGAQLTPSNALEVWRLADVFTLPALEKAAGKVALLGFEELPAQLASLASGAEVLMCGNQQIRIKLTLAQKDLLVAKSEESVSQWVKRWWEAGERPEAELLAVTKHVRLAVMAKARTVGACPKLDSTEAQRTLFNAALSAVGDTKPAPRSGVDQEKEYAAGQTDKQADIEKTRSLSRGRP